MLELVGFILVFIVIYFYIRSYVTYLKIRAKINNRNYNYWQEVTYLGIFEISLLNLFPISFILNYLRINDDIILKTKELMNSKIKYELYLWTTVVIGVFYSLLVISE